MTTRVPVDTGHAHPVKKPVSRTPGVVMVLAAIGIVVAVFLPWSSVNGTDSNALAQTGTVDVSNLDDNSTMFGYIVLGGAAVLLVAGLLRTAGASARFAGLLGLLAALAVGGMGYTYHRVNIADTATKGVEAGIGLWIALGAAAVAALFSLVAILTR